ncbi:MAG: hypothetical protein E7317_08240 [Clostridiales bacterium]|nr:hypothetical protein [Clostridiales bacterium]
MDRLFTTAGRISPQVRTARIDGAPPRLCGKRLLFVTDIHMRREMDADALVGLMAAQRADCILFGGDFADTHEQAVRLFTALARLRAPMGMYACPGNNDPEAFEGIGALRDALGKAGCTLLVNESTHADGLTIAGLDEYKHGVPDPARLFGKGDGFRVLLSHYPVHYAFPEEERPRLQLCGHTHGGQFRLLGLTPYSIGFECLQLKKLGVRIHHVEGWRNVEGTDMLVSKGIGMSRIPLRVGVGCEIHVIEMC